ncbi:MAG: hypothetical protein WCO69_03975 [Candidatus Omnitrophota bacterium]
MASKKKVKKAGVIPRISKGVKDFMMDEEGKIKKKDIAKLGVSMAALGMMVHSDAAADVTCPYITSDSHSNALVLPVAPKTCYEHANTHTNHCNHSSHSVGGWC